MAGRITSPCVGVCSTTVGDNVCRGCQRTSDEILDWFGMTAMQREQRMEQLDAMREHVAGRFFSVVNSELLNEQLKRHRIRVRQNQPPLSCVVELLRTGRQQMRDLSCYGLVAHQSGSIVFLYEQLCVALADAADARCRAAENHFNL
ncbi:DUF1289 domain-containing protein [Halomonas halocynthiae]|uniref:DUF1289 domain-containing protein n=1 Tax=Halomonas halocynthiae TaxID=176290 RepID=UPI00054EEBAD|nr:DUF1289 domain-containing protein [Halomonas halocynthiae]